MLINPYDLSNDDLIPVRPGPVDRFDFESCVGQPIGDVIDFGVDRG